MSEQSKTIEIMRRIGAQKPENIRITGILQSPELAFVTLTLPTEDGQPLAALFSVLGEHEINIRFINKYTHATGTPALSLCVEAKSLTAALELLSTRKASLGIREINYRPKVRIISIYPHKERARVAERLLTTFQLNGIEPLAVNNASSVISCVFASSLLLQAMTCIEQSFELP
jgi:aspartokinase